LKTANLLEPRMGKNSSAIYKTLFLLRPALLPLNRRFVDKVACGAHRLSWRCFINPRLVRPHSGQSGGQKPIGLRFGSYLSLKATGLFSCSLWQSQDRMEMLHVTHHIHCSSCYVFNFSLIGP